jgi:hypothetical protein
LAGLLSVERNPANNNEPTHARDRIGTGPRYNVNLVLVANNFTELHARTGDAAVFLDERGRRINGQWTGSPSPVEHDILTGSNADGTLAPGLTCADWTSDFTTLAAQVGHSDGMGPNQSTAGTLASWNRGTRIRIARTPHHAAGRAASTASLGDTSRGARVVAGAFLIERLIIRRGRRKPRRRRCPLWRCPSRR